jgi:hypothetical protein
MPRIPSHLPLAFTTPPKHHRHSLGTPTTFVMHLTSILHTMTSHPKLSPLMELSSSTSLSSCGTTRCVAGLPYLRVSHPFQQQLSLRQRTPDNLAPSERALNPPMGWDCSGVEQLTYDLGGAAIAHDATTPPQHPFARTIWPGTCDAGQLTAGGLLDASQHGRVSCSPHPCCCR